MSLKSKLGIIFISTALLLCVSSAVTYTHAQGSIGQLRVLIINSYHYGYGWSDDEMRGIKETLNTAQPDIDIFTEYLDCKHFPEPEHLQFMRDNLAHKFKDIAPSIIIVADDPALDFIIKYRDGLFGPVPVVFCGINNYKPEMISSFSNCTGVPELLDVRNTMKTMLRLHPKTRKLYIVCDQTITGLATRKLTEDALKELPNSVKFTITENISIVDILQQISMLDHDSLVLSLSYSRDSKGRVFDHAELASMIESISPVPVYAVHEERLGHGIVGGWLLGGKPHGEQTAHIALRILDGAQPGSIPVDMKSASRPMFDYTLMLRFDISALDIPVDSIIINRPESFYEKYKRLFWLIICVISLLTVVIIFLSINNMRRRRAEQALRESEQKYRELVENANSIIMRWTPDGTITFFNNFAQRLFGYGENSIIGRNLINTIVPEHESTGRNLTEMIHAIGKHPGDFVSNLNENMCCDGRRVWISWANRPVFDTTGQLKEILSIGIDVTEQRHVEEIRLQLFAAIEQAVESISITDKQSCYVYVNPSFERMSGYARYELIGQHIKMMIPDDFIDMYLRENIPALVRGDAWAGTIIKKRRSGQVYEVDANISPVRNDAGQIISFVTVESDVTRERELERQLQHSQKMEAIGTLAGGIAHDFNNILGIIIGFTELAQAKIQPQDPIAEDLDQILIASDRARNLVRQILAFSRKTDYVRRVIDPVPIVNETIKLLRATIPTTINIQKEIDTECGHIFADPTELHQVIMNMSTNAAHAMETTGGILKVRMAACNLCSESAEQFPGLLSGKYIRILISDTGTGISPDIIDRIFEPFFTTKKVGKGTGMGLAVVHGIIKSLGGGISVAGTSDAGTTFEVIVPETNKDGISNIPDTSIQLADTGRIMFVDDEKMLAEMGLRMLMSLGYDAVAVEDSREALALFKRDPHSFDLIITDQTMPYMTGYDLALQVLALRPDMPIILCTGYSETVTENMAVAAGIRMLLMKPLMRKKLSEAIHRTLLSKT